MSSFLNSFRFGGITFTFFASGTSTQVTGCYMPASIAAGDLALYLDLENTSNFAIPTAVTPTGFTQIQTHTLSGIVGCRVSSHYKILVGTEGGTGISGIAPNSTSDKVILVFRPSSPITTVTSSSLNGQAVTAAPTNQSLDMSGASPLPVIGIATYGATGAITTRGDSAGGMTEVSASTHGYAKYVIYNPGDTPTTSTISMTDSGVNMMSSFYLTFT